MSEGDGLLCPHGNPAKFVLYHQSGEVCPYPGDESEEEGLQLGMVTIRPVLLDNKIQVVVHVDGMGAAETIGYMEIAKAQYARGSNDD